MRQNLFIWLFACKFIFENIEFALFFAKFFINSFWSTFYIWFFFIFGEQFWNLIKEGQKFLTFFVELFLFEEGTGL